MIYVIYRGNRDGEVNLVDSPLPLEDMREIVRCKELELDAGVVGVITHVTWVGKKDLVVKCLADYCPPVLPRYAHLGKGKWDYVGPRLALYQDLGPGKKPMDLALWRRIVRVLDTKNYWGKTFIDYPHYPYPHHCPGYAEEAKKLALDYANALPEEPAAG
jgi:hypothetical protein